MLIGRLADREANDAEQAALSQARLWRGEVEDGKKHHNTCVNERSEGNINPKIGG